MFSSTMLAVDRFGTAIASSPIHAISADNNTIVRKLATSRADSPIPEPAIALAATKPFTRPTTCATPFRAARTSKNLIVHHQVGVGQQFTHVHDRSEVRCDTSDHSRRVRKRSSDVGDEIPLDPLDRIDEQACRKLHALYDNYLGTIVQFTLRHPEI